MPNPKLGTVTNDIKKAVKAIKSGQMKLKMIKMEILVLQLEKKVFQMIKIKENFNAIFETIKRKTKWN